MQRRKGKKFEQAIARVLRARWPDAIVRRATQSDGAFRSDVYISGTAPPILHRLWLELQHANETNPEKKLAQAERDADRALSNGAVAPLHPVVIWHQTRRRRIWTTMRLCTLRAITESDQRELRVACDSVIVTVGFEDVLNILSGVA